MTIYQLRGCPACHFTGYAGRQAIYEFLVLNEAIKQLVIDHANAETIKQKALANGMKTLRQAGWMKVKKGLTTPEEVIRITQDH